VRWCPECCLHREQVRTHGGRFDVARSVLARPAMMLLMGSWLCSRPTRDRQRTRLVDERRSDPRGTRDSEENCSGINWAVLDQGPALHGRCWRLDRVASEVYTLYIKGRRQPGVESAPSMRLVARVGDPLGPRPPQLTLRLRCRSRSISEAGQGLWALNRTGSRGTQLARTVAFRWWMSSGAGVSAAVSRRLGRARP